MHLQSLKLEVLRLQTGKEFLNIQASIEGWIHSDTLRYNQIHHTDKYSQDSSIIWPVGVNG